LLFGCMLYCTFFLALFVVFVYVGEYNSIVVFCILSACTKNLL
jgi:hypothetical protein